MIYQYLFGVKDFIPQSLRSRVVYKFQCASCNACYIGETTRHLSTRIREHLVSDKSSHIYKHLQESETCKNSCSTESFTILDYATSKFQIKIKEALYFKWDNPSLNGQLKQLDLSLFLISFFMILSFVCLFTTHLVLYLT